MRNFTLLLLFTFFVAGCGGIGSSDSSNDQADYDQRVGPWAETDLEAVLKGQRDSEFPKRLAKALRRKPNLRDLHAPDGALSHSGGAGLLILERAGFPVNIPDRDGMFERGLPIARNTFTFEGRVYHAPGTLDKTQVRLPLAKHRVPVPPGSLAILSMTESGQVRVSKGEHMSTSVWEESAIEEFGASLRAELHPDGSAESIQPLDASPPIDSVSIELAAGGAMAAIEALQQRGEASVILQPAEDATVTDVVAFFSAALAEQPLFIALDFSDGAEHQPQRLADDQERKLLTLKLDADLTWQKIRPVLQDLGQNIPMAVLLAQQDLSNLASFDLDGYPGGLPGGVLVPLQSK